MLWAIPAAQAAVSLAGGFFGSRSAKKAAKQQQEAANNYANTLQGIGQRVQGGYDEYGRNLGELATEAQGLYKFNPISARSPFANVSYQDGELNVEASPDAQGMMDMGRMWLNQAGMFDRAGAEDAYYGNLQRLASTSRNDALASTMRRLQAKGGFGLGSNAKGNMLMYGLGKGWSDQDAQFAKMAMDYGGTELDRMITRGQGMFTGAANLTNQGFNQWQVGQGMAQPFQMGGIQSYLGYRGQALRSPLEGMLAGAGYDADAAKIRYGGTTNYAASRDAATQGMIRGVTGAINNGLGMFSGYLNNAAMPPNMFSAPSGNMDAVLAGGHYGPY